jgi:hypothetical protein
MRPLPRRPSLRADHGVQDPTPITAIAWTDHYRIAASSTGAEFGCKPLFILIACQRVISAGRPNAHCGVAMVYNNTEPKTISAGQLFVLEKDWTSTSPNTSSNAPEKGFLFVNMPSASAVLFKTVRNKKTPIYVTATGSGTPPPGKHSLTPTGEILLFFMTQDAQTAFDVNLVNSEAYELLYIEQPNATVLFNKDGHWEFINHVGEDGISDSVSSTLPYSKL